MASRSKPHGPSLLHKGHLAGSSSLVLDVFRRAVGALDAASAQYCLVGGLARSYLAEARSTKDVDFAVSAGSESEVDDLVRSLQSSGFILRELFQKKDGRVATVRLTWREVSVRTDLLFATSGIERLVVRAAVRREVMPGVSTPVILRPHLIAMKLVAGRDQDLSDISVLLADAVSDEIAEVDRVLKEVPKDRRTEALRLWRFIKDRRRSRKEDLVAAPKRMRPLRRKT